jgi:glycosyltransferase involved in cell wall biosynthesis
MPFVYSNTQIITISESSKQEILKLGLGGKSEIKIIHPGIDDNEFFKMEKTTYPSFLYLGRLQAYKNIDIAIKAFVKVYKKFPDAIFTIAGSGENMENLKKIVMKFNIGNNVIFTGRVSENEKKILLAENWVAIQPSMMEGFGITTIEANACGTPVIASNVHGLRDSVIDKKTGILVKLKDIDSLEKAMLSCIIDNDLRKSLSTNAYYWSKNFSWNKSADEFYLEIIKLLDKSMFDKNSSIQFSKNININI